MRKTLNRIVALLSLAICLLACTPANADATRLPGSGFMSNADVAAFAMRWFANMQKGYTDRSEYVPAYAVRITDQLVADMSKTLNRYGASPLRAEIVQTRTSGNQTFYVVKFVFPRGDATSLLFGLDTQRKITGIAIEGLAGD